LAQVPFSFLQGIGKPDVTSKLHVAELLVYIPALWLLVGSFGIIGAAIAWTGRVAIDTALLFYSTRRSFPPLSGIATSTGLCALVAIACLLCIVIVPEGNLSFPILAAVLLLLMTVGWKVLLPVDERSYLLAKLSQIKLTKE
jgi:O-antigen/teichoic acid export membrane protein